MARRQKAPKTLAPLTPSELDVIEKNLDNETEWETIDEFWQVWSPRCSDRLRRLIATCKKAP